jgi:hypothetical protein
MKRWATRDTRDDEYDLGEECEAFLRGTYLHWLREEGLPIPAWAHLNRAAHAELAEVREHILAEDTTELAGDFPAAALLVEAILVAAATPEELPAVQRDVLVPLELDLMQHRVSPRGAVERVTSALF